MHTPPPIVKPGAALRAARHRVGLTQAALAAHLGVGQSTVSMWESGRNRPSVQVVVHVSDVTGVPVSELLGRTEAR